MPDSLPLPQPRVQCPSLSLSPFPLPPTLLSILTRSLGPSALPTSPKPPSSCKPHWPPCFQHKPYASCLPGHTAISGLLVLLACRNSAVTGWSARKCEWERGGLPRALPGSTHRSALQIPLTASWAVKLTILDQGQMSTWKKMTDKMDNMLPEFVVCFILCGTNSTKSAHAG